MDDNVGDPGVRRTDELLDLARARMGGVEGRAAVEAQREEGDEPDLRAEEAQLARRAARRLADDSLDGARVDALLARLRRLRQRLEMGLHGVHLRDGREDRVLQ